MGVDATVRQILREQLITLVDSPPVAWEGYAFDPTPGTTFFREKLVFQDRRVDSLGPYCRIVHEGVWMVDVYTPGQKGASVADNWTDQLIALFAPGTALEKSGVTVRIDRAFAGDGISTAE